jgi:hypothetical protein
LVQVYRPYGDVAAARVASEAYDGVPVDRFAPLNPAGEAI